jgi:hypothetical protein
MPFLGNQPSTGYSTIVKDDFTANGNDTVFTLSRTAASANSIAVFVGNVRQEPTDAYTVNGTTLTMSAAPANGANFYVLHISGAVENSSVPASGTIGTSQLANNAVHTGKIADNQITSAKLANAINITSGNSLTIDSGATITNNGTASGFPNNTPSFKATLSADQSIPAFTWTKVLFDTETWDTDSAFNTTTGEFTVPSGKGGKYVFICAARSLSISDGERALANIYINGVTQHGVNGQYSPINGGTINFTSVFIHDLSAGDVAAFYYYQSSTAARNITSLNTYFSAFKLLE